MGGEGYNTGRDTYMSPDKSLGICRREKGEEGLAANNSPHSPRGNEPDAKCVNHEGIG